MKKTISYFLFISLLVGTGSFLVPQEAFASHKAGHEPPGQAKDVSPTPPQPAKESKESKEEKPAEPGKPEKPSDKKEAPAVPNAPSSKIREMPLPEIRAVLGQGAVGEDVKRLQEFLVKFPHAYPEKAVNGNFDQTTQQAVKKFQTSIGLAANGTIDKDTKEAINELITAIERKRPPRITEISPAAASAVTMITLRGRGFTEEDNAIFVKGKTVLKGLRSYDGGTTLEFVLPSDLPCSRSEPAACPIKVINANGISNAKPLKLVQLAPGEVPEEPIPVPSPTPEPVVTPPPPPPEPTLTITKLNPSQGVVGASVTITGTGFTATNNSVNFGGVSQAVTNLSSADGTTLIFTVPQSPCGVGETCSVSVTNSRGTSNVLSFLLLQTVTPIKVDNPNGGEVFLQGRTNTIRWSGGTDRVQVLLVNADTTAAADPANSTVGWITTGAVPNSSLTWDAKTVCNLEGSVCSKVEPGDYKILALSEDEVGTLTLWDAALERAGNWDMSDNSFRIHPESSITVLKPNGGEYFAQGQKIVICFDAYNITGKVVVISLLKGSTPYLTINANYSLDQVSGNFVLEWTIPSDLPPASDYTIKVADASVPSVSDTSDRTFSVYKVTSSIQVWAPPYPYAYWWYPSKWITGFQGRVEWYSQNLPNQAVNINLLKGGVLYKTLATNVSQQYYGSSQTYSSGWFYASPPVPADIPAGTDYAIEITDAQDPSIRGVGKPFEIVKLPDQITLKGRLIDHFTQNPFANERVSAWGITSAALTTDPNGNFSLDMPLANLISSRYQGFNADPSCYEYKYFYVYVDQYGPYLILPIFEFIGPSRYFRIYSGEASFGEIPFWQKMPLTVSSDVPTRHGLYYRDSDTGRAAIGMWLSGNYVPQRSYGDVVPVALDAWLKFEDPGMSVTYTPYTKLPVGACSQQVVTSFNQTMKWEAYNVSISGSSYYSMKVGSSMKLTYAATGGNAPYAWSVAFGELPPGLALDSATGIISGSPTTAGGYEAMIRVTDVRSVSSAKMVQILVYTSTGTLPPTIKINYPYANYIVWPGGGMDIGWWSSGITSKTVAIDLMKGGNFYLSINPNYTQYAETGYFSFWWATPTDLPPGSDYTMRIYDKTNPAVFGETAPFWVLGRTGAFWSGWSTTYSPYLTFQFATSTLPYLKEFRLYQKRPGDGQFSLAETFSVLFQCKTCQITSASGKWWLWNNWQDYWGIWGQGAHSSTYPKGMYEYQITTVALDGIESAPLTRFRLYNLEKVNVVSPVASESPIQTTTPTVKWTIPADWPQAQDRRFTINVRNDYTTTPYLWSYISTIAGPHDTVGFRKYEPTRSTYDPSQWEVAPLQAGGKYNVDVWSTFSVYDPLLLNSVGYAAMGASTATFWLNP